MKRSLAGKIQRTNVTGSFCRDRKILLAPCTSNEIAGTQVQYLKQIIPMLCSVRYAPRHTAGIYRRYYRYRTIVLGTTSIPVPDTSISSVQHQHRYRTLRQLRYDTITDTGHFGKSGTTSTPIPDTSVSSVRYQYLYRTLR